MVATVHALTAGTDARSGPFLIAAVASIGLVAVLTAVRVTRSGGLGWWRFARLGA